MRNPLRLLKPRSSFDSFEAHRLYAREAASSARWYSWFIGGVALLDGMGVVRDFADKDPTTPVSTSQVAAFAVEMALTQILHSRATRAEDRAKETWADFTTIQQAELAKRRPPAEETPPPQVAPEPPIEPAEQAEQQPLPPAEPKNPDNQ